MEMCFCCCCAHCSRNCLDCMAEAASTAVTPTPISAANVNSSVKEHLRSKLKSDDQFRPPAAGKKMSRKRPARMMSRCWHWMMLLLIILLFGAAMCLLSSSSASSGSIKSACSLGSARWSDKGTTRDKWSCGEDRGEEYPENVSLSYHYEQLAGEWPEWQKVARGGRNGREDRVNDDSGSDGCGRGWAVNDSWGASYSNKPPPLLPMPPPQCNRNLLQRILDSGIKSMQFLSSQFQRTLFTRTTINERRSGEAHDWGADEDDENGQELKLMLLVVEREEGENELDPKDQRREKSAWTLSNGVQKYHVSIVASQHRRCSSRSASRRAESDSAEQKNNDGQEKSNESFVDKNQFSSSNPPGDAPPGGTEGSLVDSDSDPESEGSEQSMYTMRSGGEQRRSFNFLRKLQYFEEDEDEENGQFSDEEDEENAEEGENEEFTGTTQVDDQLNSQQVAEEQILSSEEQTIDKSSDTMKRSSRVGLESEISLLAVKNSQLVGANPLRNSSITLRGLERFLELIQSSSASSNVMNRKVISPTFRGRQLLRLQQRLSSSSGGDGGGGVKIPSADYSGRRERITRSYSSGGGRGVGSSGDDASATAIVRLGNGRGSGGGRQSSAKKCKLNGTSTTCRRRRRKGMRRKAPASVDNVQFRSTAEQREDNNNRKGSGSSSGDKWRFILDNFCAKSHLHGQLPKLIAKLERQQQQQRQGKKPGMGKQQDHGQRTTIAQQEGRKKEQIPQRHESPEWMKFDRDLDEEELTLASETTDSLRLEVIKEQILKKLGLKRAPNITTTWTAAAESTPSAAVHNNDTQHGWDGGGGEGEEGSSSRRMVEKKTVNFMLGNGPSGIQLPNNNSQFFIHDGHTKPMDQELFLSKELILATLYRAQLASGGDGRQQQQQSHGSSYADSSYERDTNRLFDDLHSEERGRRKRRKRKRKSNNDDEEHEDLSEDLKSHTRRYLEDEFDEEDENFHEDDAFEERSHRYQWENNQQDDDDQMNDEDNYGQSREIITFAERGKLLNGRQHLLEFKPVGDHQTPGGDFRIRSALLWLKVEHLKPSSQQQRARGAESDAARRRNVTIWIFNMKSSNWNNKRNEDNDCSANFNATKSDEKVDRNCPNSESPSYDATATTLDGDVHKEIKLNEKDFNRVSELILTHTIFLPTDSSSTYQATPELDNRRKFRGEEEDSNSSPPDPEHSQSTLNSNGWHRFDITAVARRWNSVNRAASSTGAGVGQRPINLQLLVDCTGCRRAGVHVHLFHSNKLWSAHQQHPHQTRHPPPPPLINENRPFLVARTEPNAMKRVRRRAVDCSGARNGLCCKQRFYVSFKAIGWDDWIISPNGYFANYCRGSCAHRTPDQLPTKYSAFMDEFRRLGKMVEMQPCCTPLKYSSMDMVYFDRYRKIVKRKLPQMIVEECGCP